jgi:hypothetical protein
MSRKRRVIAGIVIFLVVVAGLAASISYFAKLPNRLSQHETIVLGQCTFIPGAQTAVRVVVRGSKDGSPLNLAQVSVFLTTSFLLDF